MSRLVCATHGHCFDGLASAALLTDLVVAADQPSKIDYIACSYGPEIKAPVLDGDINALLDFRYYPASSLTYYFDHHPTAFAHAEAQTHFEKRAAESARQFVWDPKAVSCAGVIATVAARDFGLSLTERAELIAWADTIDGAQFDSAEEATDRANPLMRLVAVVERFGDSAFLAKAVPLLRSEGLTALSQARFVRDHYRPLSPKFREYETRVRTQGEVEGRVAFIDLSDKPVSVVAKFAQYRHYPAALYSVLIAKMGGGLKLSIGFNPWNGQPLDHDIGAICARHGGGGHSVVGAVSFPAGDAARAHELARAIIHELQTPSQ